MLSHPDLVAGEGRFDTELMSRSYGQVLSKGGAEGVQCLSRIGEGLGVAIKVEDGPDARSRRWPFTCCVNWIG